MKQVMNGIKKQSRSLEKLAVLRLELDYELAVLFEAMQDKNKEQVEQSKEKLKGIRKELIKIKAI